MTCDERILENLLAGCNDIDLLLLHDGKGVLCSSVGGCDCVCGSDQTL